MSATSTLGVIHFDVSVLGIPDATPSFKSDTTPATVNLNLDTSSLAAGTYFGLVAMVARESANQLDAVPLIVDVSATDTAPPAIGDVTNIIAEAASAAGAIVTFATPSASDDFDPAPIVSASPASGSVFPLGVTTVTVTATDASGNTSTKTFTVTVNDMTLLALSLPSNIAAVATSAAGALVTYTATAGDIFDGVVPVNCASVSGSVFPLGTTTFTDVETSQRLVFIVYLSAFCGWRIPNPYQPGRANELNELALRIPRVSVANCQALRKDA